MLVWPEGLIGSPVSWTGPPRLPILRIFAFDGSVTYAFTKDQLLRVRSGEVDILHRASKPIRDAHLSPDGQHIVWLEKADIARGYVAPVQLKLRPVSFRLPRSISSTRGAAQPQAGTARLTSAAQPER